MKYLSVLFVLACMCASTGIGKASIDDYYRYDYNSYATVSTDVCSSVYIGQSCREQERNAVDDKQPSCEVCAVLACNKCYPHGNFISLKAKVFFMLCVKRSQQECSEL